MLTEGEAWHEIETFLERDNARINVISMAMKEYDIEGITLVATLNGREIA